MKIDRSFVMNMLGSKEDIAIVESTIDLAHSLGMETVAEGVETLEILQRLATVGCWAAQGYHVARPIPSADVAGKIREIDAQYATARTLMLSSEPASDRDDPVPGAGGLNPPELPGRTNPLEPDDRTSRPNLWGAPACHHAERAHRHEE